ncbi:MAG TPA: Fur family transcriptional regulator [Chloroflexota bacterium]|jgi:Fur family peroxide stress response transcriptional regulator|nr:Fur family transcriptional regulator [Chloroflexota bacterium]
MVSSRQRYNQLVRALGQAGYRLTPQRTAVLHVLAEATGHPSVAQIHELARRRCRSTSRATVYNTVRVLKQLGALEELEYAGRAHRYVVQPAAQHAHLICTRCQRIDDYAPPGLWPTLEAAAAASPYRVLAYHVNFYGECPACQRTEREPAGEEVRAETIAPQPLSRADSHTRPERASGSMGGTTHG